MKVNFYGKRWNGKYKEYDKITKIIIEQEYINGEIIRDNISNENNLNDNKTEKVIKEFYEESDKIRFEGIYLKDEKWNGIMYNKNDNFKIEIKDKWNLKESNLKIKYLGENKYIIHDISGIIKEYENGYLIYEGEYINDKRNGRGKEFDINGKITFEGEYKNGNRWNGKIKELITPMHDEIEFEGEYINGETIGIIKKYHYDGKLEFECEYKNDKRNGYGKEYKYNGKLLFEGE